MINLLVNRLYYIQMGIYGKCMKLIPMVILRKQDFMSQKINLKKFIEIKIVFN